MEHYNSIYLGICVQNNDPEYRGRIKVWVPHVNASVYDKWIALKQDREFKFPGSNVGPDLSLIIDELKDILPWAEYCGPVMGQSATGYYHAFDDIGFVSDAPYPSSGGKPGVKYEGNSKISDAFSGSTGAAAASLTKAAITGGAAGLGAAAASKLAGSLKNKIKGGSNPSSNGYKPTTYSNAAKGLFSIPNVGAHLWVFFREGNPLYPVYMGSAMGAEDFKSIYCYGDDAFIDYPQKFESNGKKVEKKRQETLTYRNKMVLNQRGAALEIVSTNDREKFKVTQYSGGFFEINNKATVMFSPENYQSLTNKDKFTTVKGKYNISAGSLSLSVGSLSISNLPPTPGGAAGALAAAAKAAGVGATVAGAIKSPAQQWMDAYKPIANALSLSPNDPNLASVVEQQTPLLAAAEAQMGEGNGILIESSKGITVNALPFFDPKSYTYEVPPREPSMDITQSEKVGGLFYTKIPKIIPVYLNDPPWGTKTENIGNKWNVLVGSNGIKISTTGKFNISSIWFNVGSRQINLSTVDDFNIDAGTYFNVISNNITLKTRTAGQVLVDDGLGATGNLIIGGGAYFGGEVYMKHVTAPAEFQVTEATTIKDNNYIIRGRIIKIGGSGPISSNDEVYIVPDTVLPELTEQALVISQPHTHYFKNLPLTLVENVAAQAADRLDPKLGPASADAVVDGYNTVRGQLTSNPNGPVDGIPEDANPKPPP